MILVEKDNLEFSNATGFVYSKFVIINCLNKQIKNESIAEIKLLKRRNSTINLIALLLAFVLLIVFLFYEYELETYYTLALSVSFFMLNFFYKTYKYQFILHLYNGEIHKAYIKKSQKEELKNLIYQITKKIKKDDLF